MNNSAIAALRIQNQQIAATRFDRPDELVSWLGAVQAQDYPMAKWALGLRLNGATEQSVEAALDSGSVIRTHIMRPTWHFVAAVDFRWLLELTAPGLKKGAQYRLRQLALDGETLLKSAKLIAKLLEGGNHLTRSEIASELDKKGVTTSPERSGFIMYHAELDGLVCNGCRRNGQHTYALLDERVPPAAPPTKEEALARLAKKYFSSHGPATAADFRWWSGLTAAEVKTGMESVRSHFVRETVGTSEYWLPAATHLVDGLANTVYLLPSFDEYTISYKNREAVLAPDVHSQAITGNGIFKPIIVVNGRVAGIWKRSLKNDSVLIEPTTLKPGKRVGIRSLVLAAERYGSFMGMKVRVM